MPQANYMQKILIIDDDKDLCFLLNQFLCRKGYEVTVKYSGEEALEYLQQFPATDLDRTYTVALQTMVFAAADPEKYRVRINGNVTWLERAQHRVALLRQETEEYYGNFRVTADLIELRNLVEVAGLIVRSALHRKESRGLHYNLDYPEMLPEAKDTILTP